MALFQFEYTPQNLTISAIHAFYSRERKLYSRLVFDLHMDPVRSMEIIAFWLWLEEKEKPDIIVNMSSSDDPTLLTAALVARDFIATLRMNTPFEGMSADMARIGQELAVIPRNAYSGIVRADPDLPLTDYVPDDERTLFVTFSNGYPLTKQELQSFFMRYFGDVESVHIQTSNGGRPPQYAYVTFCTLQTVFRVLNGTQKAKFIINGKHLWARRYIPRRNHPNNDANRGASRFSTPQTQTF